MQQRKVKDFGANYAHRVLVDFLNTLIDIDANLEEGEVMTELERHMLETYTEKIEKTEDPS